MSSTSLYTPHHTSIEAKTDEIRYAPSWTSLFAFTSRAQALLLSISFLVAVATGAAGPIYNIFFGKVLDAFTEFAQGQLDGPTFKRKIAIDSAIIAAIGMGNWILNAIFLSLWISFGEAQARICRKGLFDRLLDMSTSWYDTRQSGISALMPRIQS